MGLISPGGENLLDFLELRQVLSTYDWDLRDPLCGLRKGKSPCELLVGLSGFLSLRCFGLRPCVESVSDLRIPLQCRHGSWGTSGVSPWESVLVSSGGMHVRFPPELKLQCHASLRVDQGICVFPSRLSHEAFPGGFPTGLSHVPPWCASILCLKVEAVQVKQVSLEWSETSGGLCEWYHDPGVPLAIPVESASS